MFGHLLVWGVCLLRNFGLLLVLILFVVVLGLFVRCYFVCSFVLRVFRLLKCVCLVICFGGVWAFSDCDDWLMYCISVVILILCCFEFGC